MGHMRMVAQHDLNRVLTRGQFQHGFGLAAAKMDVMFVDWQTVFQIGRPIRPLAQCGAINQQMVVPGIFFFGASWCHAHTR